MLQNVIGIEDGARKFIKVRARIFDKNPKRSLTFLNETVIIYETEQNKKLFFDKRYGALYINW